MLASIDTHVHSIASGHAFNTTNEILSWANKNKIDLVCITDHGPSMKGAPHAGYFEMMPEVPLRTQRCLCLMGCECNILDSYGRIDLDDTFLKNLDIVLVGLHRLTPYSHQSTTEMNTSGIVNAMKNPYVDIVAHPYSEAFPVDINIVVKAAARYSCMLELNCRIFSNTPDTTLLTETYGRALELCTNFGVSVVIGTDAHIVSKLGDISPLQPIKAAMDAYRNVIVSDAKTLIEILLRKRARPKIDKIRE